MFMRAIGFNAGYGTVIEQADEKGIGYVDLINTEPVPRTLAALIIRDAIADSGVDVTFEDDEQAKLLEMFKDLDGLTDEKKTR
ncbi:hypothetical protein FACS189490_04740 [Clostridia bacterium]|nr:hypothetical protein FACS189490_04740 [Clostridia bacterium]